MESEAVSVSKWSEYDEEEFKKFVAIESFLAAAGATTADRIYNGFEAEKSTKGQFEKEEEIETCKRGVHELFSSVSELSSFIATRPTHFSTDNGSVRSRHDSPRRRFMDLFRYLHENDGCATLKEIDEHFNDPKFLQSFPRRFIFRRNQDLIMLDRADMSEDTTVILTELAMQTTALFADEFYNYDLPPSHPFYKKPVIRGEKMEKDNARQNYGIRESFHAKLMTIKKDYFSFVIVGGEFAGQIIYTMVNDINEDVLDRVIDQKALNIYPGVQFEVLAHQVGYAAHPWRGEKVQITKTTARDDYGAFDNPLFHAPEVVRTSARKVEPGSAYDDDEESEDHEQGGNKENQAAPSKKNTKDAADRGTVHLSRTVEQAFRQFCDCEKARISVINGFFEKIRDKMEEEQRMAVEYVPADLIEPLMQQYQILNNDSQFFSHDFDLRTFVEQRPHCYEIMEEDEVEYEKVGKKSEEEEEESEEDGEIVVPRRSHEWSFRVNNDRLEIDGLFTLIASKATWKRERLWKEVADGAAGAQFKDMTLEDFEDFLREMKGLVLQDTGLVQASMRRVPDIEGGWIPMPSAMIGFA